VRNEAVQTFRAIVSLILRVALLGIAVPVLLGDFPEFRLPSRFTTEWTAVMACDLLAVFAPLAPTRKLAFLGGAAALGAHYYYKHDVPVFDMAYLGVAIVFVLLPNSGRKTGRDKWVIK
jgi:hypothetical protein